MFGSAQGAMPLMWGTRRVNTSIAAQWAELDEHFAHHAIAVRRFRHAGPDLVRRMWQTPEERRRLVALSI
jgi:hypothetical protein